MCKSSSFYKSHKELLLSRIEFLPMNKSIEYQKGHFPRQRKMIPNTTFQIQHFWDFKFPAILKDPNLKFPPLWLTFNLNPETFLKPGNSNIFYKAGRWKGSWRRQVALFHEKTIYGVNVMGAIRKLFSYWFSLKWEENGSFLSSTHTFLLCRKM